MTNLDCLKALCERMFGYKSNGDNIADVLNDMYRTCEHDYSKKPFIKTGEKWLDGKPIYRLAVTSNLEDLASDINEYHPDTIVKFYGQALSDWGHLHPIPSVVGVDSRYKLDLLQDNITQEVKLQYGEFFQDHARAYAIVEFTVKDEEDV